MTASDGEHGDHSVHVPAMEDRPRGYGAASWFPIVTAFGAVSFVVGVGVYVVGSNVEAIVNPLLGIALSLLGVLVITTSVLGWVYRAYVAHDWERRAGRHENRFLWAMLLYFPVELALVGAATLYFAIIYYTSWPPGDLPPIFIPLVWYMSGIMLVSAVTNLLANRALEKGRYRRFLGHVAATSILGVVFLAAKAWNWNRLLGEGYTLSSGTYWTAFYAMDGLHAVLVVIGVVFMLVVFVRGLAGHYTPERDISVTTSAWYWWIVDSIWLILVVELYATAFICRSVGTC